MWTAVLWSVAAAVSLAWVGLGRLPDLAASLALHPAVAPKDFFGHWTGTAGAVLAALLFGIVLRAAGRLGLGWLGAGAWMHRTERTAVRLLGGAGMVATALMGAGFAGLLNPPLLWVTGAVVAMLARARARTVVSRRRHPIREDLREGGDSPRVISLLMAGVLLLLGLAALAPQIWTDPLAYHLAAPQRFVTLHRDVGGPNFCFRFPLLAERLIGVTRGLLPPAAFLAISLGSLLALLHGWTARRWGMPVARLAVAGTVASSLTGFNAVQPKPDLLAAAFVLLAVASVDDGTVERPRGAALVLSGLATGWAFAAKYPAVLPGLAVLGWQLARGTPSLVGRARRIVLLAVGAASAAGPFLLRGWLLSGDPVYPFSGGGLDWPPESGRLFECRGCPGRDFMPWWSGLRVVATQAAPLATLGVPLLLGGAGPVRRAGARVSGLAAVCTVAVGGWLWLRPCVRYMYADLPLVAVLAAVGLVRSPLWDPARRTLATGAVLLVLGAGSVHALLAADQDAGTARSRFAVGAGLESEAGFLARTLTTHWRAATALGPPRGGRLLLVGDSRAAWFGRSRLVIGQDYSDMPLVLAIARESRTPGEVGRRFRELGITEVLVNYIASEYTGAQAEAFFRWSGPELSRYAAYWTRHARWLQTGDGYDGLNGGYARFELRRTAAAPVGLPFLPGTEGLAAARDGETPVARAARLVRLVARAPGIALFETRLGASEVATGDWSHGRSHLERGLACGFETPGILANLGRALAGLGLSAEARAAFARASGLAARAPAHLP